MSLNPGDIKSDPALSTTPTGFKDGSVVASTPMAAATDVQKTTATPKLDVSKMFEQMGSKLGWFQYSDLDTALKTLSKSTKKKSSRPRRHQDDKISVTNQTQDKLDNQTSSSTKQEKKKNGKQSATTNIKPNKHQKIMIPDGKENSRKQKPQKNSREPDTPLKEKDLHYNEEKVELSNNEVGVPLRPSKAYTDLTKSPLQERKGSVRKDRRNALSLKKGLKDKKIVESERVSLYKDTKDSRSARSVCPELPENLKEQFNEVNANDNCRSSSESPEDFGIPARESTRIFSESGLGCGLDSVDLSRISLNHSKNISGLSWINDCNDDSYKQLNIQSVKNSIGTADGSDVCLHMKSLQLDDSDLSKKNDSHMSGMDKQDLYMTAVGSPLEIKNKYNIFSQNLTNKSITETQQHAHQKKVLKMSLSSSSRSSFSSYEVVDVSTQVDSDLEHGCIKNIIKSDDNKSEDQTSKSEAKSSNDSKHSNLPQSVRSTSASSSSGSFCEVADVSLQTSIIENEDNNASPKMTSSVNEFSFVEVQDMCIQTNGSQKYGTGSDSESDCKGNPDVYGNNVANNSIPIRCVDDDIMILDIHGEGRTFSKREPSIYFDAKDLSSEILEFKYKRRDPSLYFDAKQMLSDSSKSSESNSPVTLATNSDINYPCNHNPSDESIEELKDDRVECEIESELVNHTADNSKPEVKKCQGEKSFSIFSESDDEIVDNKQHIGFSKKSRVSLSSNGSGSLSSPANCISPDSPANCISPESPANLSTTESPANLSSPDSPANLSSPDSPNLSSPNSPANLRSPGSTANCISPDSPANLSSADSPANLSSPDSPANLRSRLLSRKHKQEQHSHKDKRQDKDPQSSKNHWRTKKQVDLDSASDDDLESFFQKMRTTSSQNPKEKPEQPKSLDEFIVADDDVSSDSDDQGFYLSTNSSVNTKLSNRNLSPIKFKDSDSEEEVFKTPVSTRKIRRKKPSHTPDNFGRVYKDSTPEYTYSFLKSLGEDLPEHKCNAEALRYKKTFKKNREALTKKLFRLYNETVFDCELPEDLDILWNNRLLRTAGYCAYKRSATSDSGRSVRVELSTKVCDSAERVRDTLIHELCHAAVWLLNGKTDGHGPYWKYWARKSNLTHPEIPVIGRCHNYSINTKYTYQCSKCGYRIGRHSKSLNTERKVCGYCHGTFILLQNQASKNSEVSQVPKTPRTPNKFALFVKENYGEIKRREKLPHKDVMKILGQEFAAKNKISEG